MSAGLEARPPRPSEPGPQPPAVAPTVVPEVWDPDRELRSDRRAERRLFYREILVLVVIAGLILLRVLYVHGS